MRLDELMARLLEDGHDVGLGGPPNGWHSLHVIREQGFDKHGHPYLWRNGLTFLNDSFEIGISVFEEECGQVTADRWMATLPVWVFRRMALWYLWRWAWGEWFGLRRWLFYRWLHHKVAGYDRARARWADEVKEMTR